MSSDAPSRIRLSAEVATILIAIVLVCAGLRQAQSVMAPTLLALVIGVVLSPISALWEKIGLPHFVGALLSLIFALLVILFIAALALPVASRIADAWPNIMEELRSSVAYFQDLFRGLESAGEEMQDAIAAGEGGSGAQTGGDAAATSDMSVPSTTDALFLAPAVAGQTITFAGILFFFLMTRRELYAFIAGRVASQHSASEIAQRLVFAERQVARYFLTISVVNLGFGAATAVAMTIVGMPSPMLWGAAVFVMNYVLYLGPAIVACALLVGGIVVFDGAYAIVPSLAFVGLNLIEAQFVTPTAIGRTLSINPLLVFFTLVFFLWLWGPLGGFVAIPLVLWIMALSNEVQTHRRERAAQKEQGTA